MDNKWLQGRGQNKYITKDGNSLVVNNDMDTLVKLDISSINPNTAKLPFLMGHSLPNTDTNTELPIQSFVNNGLYDRHLTRQILEFV